MHPACNRCQVEAIWHELPSYHPQVEEAFKQFDLDKSGQVSFAEFRKAVERFGLSVAQGGNAQGGGVPEEILQGLFDRCDAAASGPNPNPGPSPDPRPNQSQAQTLPLTKTNP